MRLLHPQPSDALVSTTALEFASDGTARTGQKHPLPDPQNHGDTPTPTRDGSLFYRLRWGTGQEPVIEALTR